MNLTVCVERGARRVLAAAPAWPRWCRSARSGQDALLVLLACRERDGAALAGPAIEVPAVENVSGSPISERLTGNAGTAFGAPSIMARALRQSIDAIGLGRLRLILQAARA